MIKWYSFANFDDILLILFLRFYTYTHTHTHTHTHGVLKISATENTNVKVQNIIYSSFKYFFKL